MLRVPAAAEAAAARGEVAVCCVEADDALLRVTDAARAGRDADVGLVQRRVEDERDDVVVTALADADALDEAEAVRRRGDDDVGVFRAGDVDGIAKVECCFCCRDKFEGSDFDDGKILDCVGNSHFVCVRCGRSCCCCD